MKPSSWWQILIVFTLIVLITPISSTWAQPPQDTELADVPVSVPSEEISPAEMESVSAEATPEPAPETEIQPVAEPAEPTPLVEEVALRITEIEIQGAEKIALADIEARIEEKIGDSFDEARMEKDRTAIRDMGWFSHVEASTTKTEEGVRLVFRVVENEILKGVEIEGVSVSKPNLEQLLALMKTKAGEVANQRYVAEDIAAIEKAYSNEGYVLARVGGREVSSEGVLKLTVLEGKITEVRITGNKKTRTYVIERELRSRAGEIYNAKVMRKDLERIFNLGFFEDARAHPEIGTEPGTVILIVEVVEQRRTGMATVAGGWASVGGFVGTVDVTKDNWRGTGQRISVRGQFGGIKSYEAAYFNPWIAPNHTSLNVSGYNRLTVREAFKSDGDSFLYDERRKGGGITLSRPLGEFSRGFVTVRRDDLQIEDIDDEDADPGDILFSDQSVRSLSLGLVSDTRDIVANPTKGSRLSFVTETAGLAGGASFDKYILDMRRYFSFGPRPKEEDIAALRQRKVLALRLIVGTTAGDPPFLEQFLLGGVDTLRGYSPDRFPGEKQALLNVEYRFPLSDTLQGVFFVDTGDAWGGSFAEQYGDPSFKAHTGYGVGIRLQSPIGPLRLDYGKGSEGAEVHFGMGQMF